MTESSSARSAGKSSLERSLTMTTTEIREAAERLMVDGALDVPIPVLWDITRVARYVLSLHPADDDTPITGGVAAECWIRLGTSALAHQPMDHQEPSNFQNHIHGTCALCELWT